MYKPDKKRKYTAIVSHDAGGAEVLSGYLKENPLELPLYYLKGPAVKVFMNRGLIDNSYKFNRNWDYRIGHLIASMSWRDGITEAMILEAKKNKIPTEIILDSWYDYSSRFGFPDAGWKNNLPDQLIICDDIAEKIIKNQNLEKICKIKKVKNFHFQDLLREYELIYKNNSIADEYLLFLSSPIAETKEKNLKELACTTVTKRDLLQDILAICREKQLKVKIRLHPSEDRGQIKFAYGSMLDGVVIGDKKSTLLEDLHSAKYVIGFSSLVLIFASLIGKTAISFSKGDLKDVFGWKKYGVYNYYGVFDCSNMNEIKALL
jgi:hypothetical protein